MNDDISTISPTRRQYETASDPAYATARPSFSEARSGSASAGTDYALARREDAMPRRETGAMAGFSGLDMVAGILSAIMMLGPLFAAYVGRMQ